LKKPRTRLPIRLFNLIASPSRLDVDELIRISRKKTNLHNLGTDFNNEPLRVLCQSINEEARLHSFGLFMIREKLIGQLENRLWAIHWFDTYPEILEQELLPVILITGLQRTGTTKMQRLLSQGKKARGLHSWEALYPAPVGDPKETRKRIVRTRMNERAVKWISPHFYHIHPIEHLNYEEDVVLLDLHFMSTSSEAIMHVPTYAKYLEQADNTEAYAFELKLLKLLQWQNAGDYWILKSPHHLEHLSLIEKLFPDLTLIWMHRDPTACIPSFMNMLYHSRCMFSDAVHSEDILDHWIPKTRKMLEQGLNDINSIKQVRHVHFDAFVKDEERVVDKIEHVSPYVRHAQRQPTKEYKSNHHYNLEDWSLTEDMIKKDLDFYYQFVSTEF
jgi:hypothetical protein